MKDSRCPPLISGLKHATGPSQFSGPVKSMIRSIAAFRAQIAAQHGRFQTFATDQNPKEIQIQEEGCAMQSQVAQLEKDRSDATTGGQNFPAGHVPSVTLEFARRLRKLKYHETLFELLSKQYEAARTDEAKASPLIQIVDRFVPLDGPSGLNRAILILGFGAIGCVRALVARLFDKLAQALEYASNPASLRGAFQFSGSVPLHPPEPRAS